MSSKENNLGPKSKIRWKRLLKGSDARDFMQNTRFQTLYWNEGKLQYDSIFCILWQKYTMCLKFDLKHILNLWFWAYYQYFNEIFARDEK